MNKRDNILLISGAGPAGISAAITAARKGYGVILVERDSITGGTVTQCLIHTLGGIYDNSGGFINKGITVELADRLQKADANTGRRKIGRVWTLQCSPEVYGRVMEDWIKEEKKIKYLRNSIVTGFSSGEDRIDNTRFIKSVTIKSGNSTSITAVDVLIDATGSGDVIRLIKPEAVINNEQTVSRGLILILRGVDPTGLRFPDNIKYAYSIRNAVKSGALPAECSGTWIDQGTIEGEAYLKLTVTDKRLRMDSDITPDLNDVIDKLISYLNGLPVFSRAYIYKTGHIGIRDSGRIVGEYSLTEEDVLTAGKFEDAACRCSWPVEYWDEENGITLKYLKEDEYYEIPMRALKVQGLRNVWAAGKCFSADAKARASARVVGCCWAMGEAAAKAAYAEFN